MKEDDPILHDVICCIHTTNHRLNMTLLFADPGAPPVHPPRSVLHTNTLGKSRQNHMPGTSFQELKAALNLALMYIREHFCFVWESTCPDVYKNIAKN